MIESLNIIIDRIEQTNVFNVVEGRQPHKARHLNSLVDDDLIEEFLIEVERLKRISRSLAETNSSLSGDIMQELQYLGETFFDQFFPPAIRSLFRSLSHSFLFFHVDYSLRNIPWELLHDGSDFLANRFYIAKSIAGAWQKRLLPIKERLQMLIIANPTEDLDWAQAEGECLYEVLSEEVSSSHLDIQLLTGGRINKLGLLKTITNCDLVHYAGHMRYDPEERESSWLLSRGKILRAREIKKMGSLPLLIFANCCLNLPSRAAKKSSNAEDAIAAEQPQFNDMAGALLQTGINNFIGTTSDVKDDSSSSLFALQFYRSIFQEKPLGKALLEARQYALQNFPKHDLTWANYSLHGNPNIHLFRKLTRRPSHSASLSADFYGRLIKLYPMPIAHAYARLSRETVLDWRSACNGSLLRQDECSRDRGDRDPGSFCQLLETFCATLQTISAIVFSYCIHNNSDETLPHPKNQIGLRQATNWIYHHLSALSHGNSDTLLPRILNGLILHHEKVNCLLDWTEEYLADRVKAAHLESYQVAFKYHLDNLLKDLIALVRFPLLYIPSLQDTRNESMGNATVIMLNGQEPRRTRVSLIAPSSPEVWDSILTYRGKVCLYLFLHREIIPMNRYLSFDIETKKLIFPLFKESQIIKQKRLLPVFRIALQSSQSSS